jgi:hypothetical protein
MQNSQLSSVMPLKMMLKRRPSKSFTNNHNEYNAEGPAHDVTILMGDLNANIGSDNKVFERVTGKNCIGEINENGELFRTFCAENNIVIGCTLFQHKDIHTLKLNSPNGRDENQIDNICMNGKWTKSLMNVKVSRGADVFIYLFIVLCWCG